MAKLMVALLVCGLLAAVSALPNRGRNARKSLETMIVGGQPVAEKELPYQISLRRSGSHICGASLAVVANRQIIVTAAHCVDSGSASSFTVIAGDVRRSDTSGNEQRRQVTRIITHEDYDYFEITNDIALLTIDQPFDLNDYVQPIPLPEQGRDTSGDIEVSGWGTTSSGGSLPDILQKVQIPVVDDDTCQRCYSQETILPSMLCAGLVEDGGKDSCQGDSGGPLRSVSGGYLAGIVSWGYGCAAPGYPGVNTEVAYFRDWIEQQVSKL